jgi:hypothetical protein
MHLDPTHAAFVFPLGLWFGFVALVCGSVWPAIAAHALNNGLIAAMAPFAESAATAGGEPTPAAVLAGAIYLAILALATASGAYVLAWHLRRRAAGATLRPPR